MTQPEERPPGEYQDGAPSPWSSPQPGDAQPGGQYPPSAHPPYGQYPQHSSPPGGPYPPAGYPYPAYGYGPPRPTNGMAVASMVLGILWIYWIGSVLALIFGYIARQQIRERGEGGDGMAVAGIVLGWVGIGVLLITLVAYLGVFAFL